MLPVQVQSLATYNRWMNEKIYQACSEISDEERKKERGAFFGSIHGILNHLLVVDKMLMTRLANTTFSMKGLDQELFSNFEELHEARIQMDEEIETWASTLTQDTLDGFLEYKSYSVPGARRNHYWLMVTHYFNHQTHHRGQLTTLLTQCGVAYGITDMVFMPGADLNSAD